MRRPLWILLCIILVSVAARLWLIHILPPFGGSDELKHVITTKFIAENGLITPPETPIFFQNGASTLIPIQTKYAIVPYANTVYAKVPVLYHLFLSGIYGLLSRASFSFMDIASSLRLIQTAIGAAGIVCFFFLARRVLKKTGDVLTATYLYATIPLLMILDATVNWDGALAALGSLSALCLITAVQNPVSTRIILSSLLLAAAYFIKPTAIFLMATIACWGGFRKKMRFSLFTILFVSVLILVPFLANNYRAYGEVIPDTQKSLYPLSIDAPWTDKILGMTVLYKRHISFLYPQNRKNTPELLETVRKTLVIAAITSILFLVVLGAGNILRQPKSLLIFFALAPVVYILLHTVLQWPHVPGVAAIPDRSARNFSALFFSIPVLVIYGLNLIKEKNLRIKKYGTPVLLCFWNALVMQTLFL